MKTIIFPTDFSISARNAVDYGMSLFSDELCTIILLHAYYLPYANPGENLTLPNDKQEQYEHLFQSELNRINDKFPNNKAKIITRIETGHVVSAIEFIEKTEDIYAIVMGTRGDDKKQESLVGNQAVAVVQNSNLPVFVIPDEAQYRPIQKILLTTDLLKNVDDVNLDPLRRIVDLNDSKVTVLHIRKKGDQSSFISAAVKKEIHRQLDGIPHNFEKTNGTSVAVAISEYIEERSMDMVITLSTKGNIFKRIFHKSIRKQIALHTQVPLLVLHYNT